MSTQSKSVGERIEDLAKADGLNLRQLSLKANVPYNTVYAIVKRNSNRVQWSTLEKIASVLDVDAAFLQGRSVPDTERIARIGEQLRVKDAVENDLKRGLRVSQIPDEYLRRDVEEAEEELISLVHDICGMDADTIPEDVLSGSIYSKWNPRKIEIVKEYLEDGRSQVAKLINAEFSAPHGDSEEE